MKNTFGDSLAITIFGESHGSAVGVVIDGITPGLPVSEEYISKRLELRRPFGKISTQRREKDEFSIISGVYGGKTCGTPICIIIPNSDTRSDDYSEIEYTARPSHADYTAECKYAGFQDKRGGGHFSGRITAGLVAASGIIMPALEKKGIYIASRIKSIAGIEDLKAPTREDMINAENKAFALTDSSLESEMQKAIEEAAKGGGSVGGTVETAVFGIPAGIGEPWFDTVEGKIAHAVFSVPAVKGIEFGLGFKFAESNAKDVNDEMYSENGCVYTSRNNNGGVLGGITNGMPVMFKTVIKPTPTISSPQKTINLKTLENTELSASGRHDPCIVHRARSVISSITAITVADMLLSHYGTDWLR